MSLDDLNKRVTLAILAAERLPADSWEAQRAFRAVADLEEEIATVIGANALEGEIARLGAIQAALSSGEPLRAIQLAERYRGDDLTEGVRAKLEKLLAEANGVIEQESKDAPKVEPTLRFTLSAA